MHAFSFCCRYQSSQSGECSNIQKCLGSIERTWSRFAPFLHKCLLHSLPFPSLRCCCFDGIQHLPSDQMASAVQWVSVSYGSEMAMAISEYLAHVGPFHEFLFHQACFPVKKACFYFSHCAQTELAPITWWKTGLRLGFPPRLASLAMQLISCTASSAQVERAFSTLGFIYGDHRQNLGSEKAKKLAVVFSALRGK